MRKFFVTGLILVSLGLTLAAHGIWPEPSSAQISAECFEMLAEADQHYLEGNRERAEQLYRRCKDTVPQQNLTRFFPEPLTDPNRLRPAARVYWREAQAGLERNQESRIFTALDLLIEQHPDFLPAYSILAEALQRFDRETEALETLEEAASLFPFDADVARARTVALRNAGKYLEASMAARLFAIVNPSYSRRSEFIALADENLEIFKGNVRAQYIGSGVFSFVSNLFLGGGASWDDVVSAADLARQIIEGESAVGASFAAVREEELRTQDALIEDPVILEYVDTIGQDIAAQMGRDEFDYEFKVAADPSLNASAFPGGKVFVNAGLILACNSEAQLAGVIAHEVAHAVLSHGYQDLASQGLIEAAATALPFRDLNQIISSSFSRDREKQADILGVRAIVGYGYAADGLRAAFTKFATSQQPEYLSTHPAPATRISYIDALIQRNGYNRYAYEGVAQHRRIQQRLLSLLG